MREVLDDSVSLLLEVVKAVGRRRDSYPQFPRQLRELESSWCGGPRPPCTLVADAADRYGANLEQQRANPDDLASGVSSPEMDPHQVGGWSLQACV